MEDIILSTCSCILTPSYASVSSFAVEYAEQLLQHQYYSTMIKHDACVALQFPRILVSGISSLDTIIFAHSLSQEN